MVRLLILSVLLILPGCSMFRSPNIPNIPKPTAQETLQQDAPAAPAESVPVAQQTLQQAEQIVKEHRIRILQTAVKTDDTKTVNKVMAELRNDVSDQKSDARQDTFDSWILYIRICLAIVGVLMICVSIACVIYRVPLFKYIAPALCVASFFLAAALDSIMHYMSIAALVTAISVAIAAVVCAAIYVASHYTKIIGTLTGNIDTLKNGGTIQDVEAAQKKNKTFHAIQAHRGKHESRTATT